MFHGVEVVGDVGVERPGIALRLVPEDVCHGGEDGTIGAIAVATREEDRFPERLQHLLDCFGNSLCDLKKGFCVFLKLC